MNALDKLFEIFADLQNMSSSSPEERLIDFPSRQKEIDAENRREAKARKQLEEEMDYGPGTGSLWPRWHHKQRQPIIDALHRITRQR